MEYWEFGMSRPKPLYRGWLNNKILLHSIKDLFNIL